MLDILFLFYLLAHTKLVYMDLIKSIHVFFYYVLTFAPTSQARYHVLIMKWWQIVDMMVG